MVTDGHRQPDALDNRRRLDQQDELDEGQDDEYADEQDDQMAADAAAEVAYGEEMMLEGEEMAGEHQMIDQLVDEDGNLIDNNYGDEQDPQLMGGVETGVVNES